MLRNWFKKDVKFVPARPMSSTYVDLYKFHYEKLKSVDAAITATERVFDANVRDQIRFYRNHIEQD